MDALQIKTGSTIANLSNRSLAMDSAGNVTVKYGQYTFTITDQMDLTDSRGNSITLEQLKSLIKLYGPYHSNYTYNQYNPTFTISVASDGTVKVDALQIKTGSITKTSTITNSAYLAIDSSDMVTVSVGSASFTITDEADLIDGSGNPITLTQLKRLIELYGSVTSGAYPLVTISMAPDGTMIVDALQINTGSI